MLTKNNTGINYMLRIVDRTLDQLAEAHFHKKINDTQIISTIVHQNVLVDYCGETDIFVGIRRIVIR
jgi:hypothetical protein